MYRDISPDILDNWLGGPKNGILTVWHKMIPASAMLVLVLERMRVSPSSWGEGGGLYVTCPHKHRYAGVLIRTKPTAFEGP